MNLLWHFMVFLIYGSHWLDFSIDKKCFQFSSWDYVFTDLKNEKPSSQLKCQIKIHGMLRLDKSILCILVSELLLLQVAFALDQTLKQQENLRLGIKSHHFSTDDLIRHYRRGNLDAVIFNQETIMFPSLGHEKSSR